jgi:hypothetical protein
MIDNKKFEPHITLSSKTAKANIFVHDNEAGFVAKSKNGLRQLLSLN